MVTQCVLFVVKGKGLLTCCKGRRSERCQHCFRQRTQSWLTPCKYRQSERCQHRFRQRTQSWLTSCKDRQSERCQHRFRQKTQSWLTYCKDQRNERCQHRFSQRTQSWLTFCKDRQSERCQHRFRRRTQSRLTGCKDRQSERCQHCFRRRTQSWLTYCRKQGANIISIAFLTRNTGLHSPCIPVKQKCVHVSICSSQNLKVAYSLSTIRQQDDVIDNRSLTFRILTVNGYHSKTLWTSCIVNSVAEGVWKSQSSAQRTKSPHRKDVPTGSIVCRNVSTYAIKPILK